MKLKLKVLIKWEKQMKFLTGIMLLMVLLSTTTSQAGNDVGNGGNIIACWNNQKLLKSIELLDYYEGRTLRGIETDLGSPNQSLDQVMAILLSRLAQKNPSRAAHYQEWYSTFFQEAKFLTGNELIKTPDSNHMAVPIGCEVLQIVTQRQPEFPEDKRYTVNKDLWDMLDGSGKAGLVLHELIYREAIVNRITESTAVRYLNSILASNRFNDLNFFDYFLMQRHLFNNTEMFGVKIWMRLSTQERNCWNSENCAYYDEYRGFIQINASPLIIPFQNEKIQATQVYLRKNDYIFNFTPLFKISVRTTSGVFVAKTKTEIKVAVNGNIEQATLADDAIFTLATGQVVSCAKDTVVNFDPTSGALIQCTLTSGQHLTGNDYDLTCDDLNMAEFNVDGRLNSLKEFNKCKGKVRMGENWINGSSPKFIKDGENGQRVLGLFTKQEQSFQIGNGKSYLFAAPAYVIFEMGNLVSGTLAHPETIKVRTTNLEIKADNVSFFLDGKLKSAYLITPELEWNFAGQVLKIGDTYKCSQFGKKQKVLSPITFHPNGEINSALLVRDSKINIPNYGKNMVDVKAGSIIHSNEKGNIISLDMYGCH